MNKTKNILEALKALVLFENYTTLPRWLEIGFGIQVYGCIGLIIYAIIK